MPRPPRKEYAGALYHVTSRGNGRGRIFFEAGDYERLLSQMAFCLETYQVILHLPGRQTGAEAGERGGVGG